MLRAEPLSTLAHTMATLAMGEFVIHILAPLRIWPPSTFFATVRIEPGSGRYRVLLNRNSR